MKILLLTQIALVVFSLLAVNPAQAQIVYGDPVHGSARFIFQSWTIDNDLSGEEFDLSQWYFPVYAFVPVYENTEIHFSTATAGSNTDSTGSDISLTGMNDTRLSVLRSLYEDKVLIGAGLNLPTGKTTLDQDETTLGNLLTSDFLSIPAKRYGEGFGIYFEGAFAEKISIYSFGLGFGYLLNSSYSPVDDVDSYNPGNRFVVAANGAIGHEYGNVYSYIRYNHFGVAVQDDVDIYRMGAITEISIGSNVLYQAFRLHGGIRVLLRAPDERLVEGDLVEFEENNNGSEFRFFSDFGYDLRGIGVVSILLDYKLVSANSFDEQPEFYEGKATLFGIGASFERVLSEHAAVEGRVKSYSGSADDGNVDLSGLELGLMLRLSL